MTRPSVFVPPWTRCWVPATSLLALLLLTGCASGGGRPASVVAPGEAAFLLPPSEGWAGAISPERALALSELHRDLTERGDLLGVLNRALEIKRADPGFHPATVLEAQVRYLSERYALVIERLSPVREAAPGFVAAELLFGRAAERLGMPLEAFDAYWSVRDRSRVAAARVEALRDAALGAASATLEEQLAAGLESEAIETLARMRAWAPGDARTLAAAEGLSAATGDPLAQLALLRQLSVEPDADDELLRRRAELEIEVGDPAAAARLADRLLEVRPEDPGLLDLRRRAQFQWRLDVLPNEVREAARRPELSRGDYALMLYWLFPSVRYGRGGEARIATDVIDHPQREAIVRVINLGLLDIDATVHRFEPEAPLGRSVALTALLRLLDAAEGEPGCTDGAPSGSCDAAVTCGLLVDAEECAASGALSGPAALELIRRALARLDAAS